VKDHTTHFPWQLCALAVAVCLGLTLAGYAVGVQPLLERRQRELSQRDELQARRATASDLAASVAALQHDSSDARQALARTSLRLQPATLVNQRLEALARLATECGVSLDEMRPGTAADSTHYQTVPIRIVGGGRYPACVTFMRNLRKTFGDMGVRSFVAANNSTIPAEPAAMFQAELVWYTELPRK
jgi:Tfp pilus assembly protein PilO